MNQSGEADEDRLKEEFLRDKQQLADLAQPVASRNLERTRELADALHAKWSELDPHLHALLMLDAIRQIDDSVEGAPWREHYAELALRDAEQLPLRLEVNLVMHIRTVHRDRLTPQEWVERRTAQMRHWFRVYHRINATVDPDWEPVPFLPTPPPPPGLTAGTSGARYDPADIEDPQEREAYIQILEEHRLLAKQHTEQTTARHFQKHFVPGAERFIVSAYAYPPYNDEELKEFLDEFVPDDAARQRIVENLENQQK